MSDPDTIATYEAVAEEYRERHGDRSVVTGMVEAFLAALEAATDDTGRVLDVGCGPGWESATFADAGHDVVGVDLAATFLETASEAVPDSDFARMDMRTIGVAAGAVDGLWACASFLHVPRADAPTTLAGFERALADCGVLALSVKRGEGTRDGDAYEGDDREFVLYQPAELRSLVASAGFSIETVDAGEDWIFLLARA